MRKFLFLILFFLILLSGLHGYAYIYSNHIINLAITTLKNREFKIDKITKTNSIFSTNLNFNLIYKDFNLNLNILSKHSPISIFNGIEMIGNIDDFSQKHLAKFKLNIPINSQNINLKADISPIKFIENHSFLELFDTYIEAKMDFEKIYLINAKLDKAKFKLGDISSKVDRIKFDIKYTDGVSFSDLNLYSSNNLKLNIKNLNTNINFIDIAAENINLNAQTTTVNLADINTNLSAKSIIIDGVILKDINSQIRLKNIDPNSYKNFDIKTNNDINQPMLIIDNLSIKDLLELKLNLLINPENSFKSLNLDGEIIAYKPISSLINLEFISIYEKFLINIGILIPLNQGYISKFKLNPQNNELIFNNSVKFSDILE
ncbi:hypothetical protein [Campylobacter lanienae]|uniref:hypothetical protein n=1 Tax=Campylobacter lanienae TaxID=75658 RepID=UPI002A912838|nr:hypothetical protein [Campylobacter lanienae]MDY6135122.1 hypothetical protein [Campylobacter lanienae]